MEEYIKEITLQKKQYDLRFGVAEPAVILCWILASEILEQSAYLFFIASPSLIAKWRLMG